MAKSKTKSEPSRLLSRAEVLEIVGVTYPTLWAWVRDGHFPAARVLGFKKTEGNKGGRVAWLESRGPGVDRVAAEAISEGHEADGGRVNDYFGG